MKKTCNVCGKYFIKKIDLGKHPCADTFLKNKRGALGVKKYPLIVGYCSCHHLSAVYKITAKDRYTKFDYSYTSGNSPIAINHFKNIAKKIHKKIIKKKDVNLLEVASNDGTFLKNFKNKKDINIVGIDPSKYMCELAKKNGLKNIENSFFDEKKSLLLKKKYGTFDLIYAANVFNHIDNPYNFLSGCKRLLKKNAIIILEFPDLDKLLDNICFDTIYHEHRNYYSKNSIIKILKKMDLRIIKFENLDYMSGSLRVYISNKKFDKKRLFNIKKKSLKSINNFDKKIKLIRKKLINFINTYKKEGKVIAGFGAATKGNTLINYCNLNYKDISFILEKSLHKIGKYTPGSGIPILSEREKHKLDAIIILPWNISKYLKEKILINYNVQYTSLEKIIKEIKKNDKKIKN